MAWYEIVALFFFLGCVCAGWIALISLESKRYKARIMRDKALTDVLEALSMLLCFCELKMNIRKRGCKVEDNEEKEDLCSR